MAPARTTKSGEANLRSIAARGVVKRLEAEVSAILLSREAISNYTIYLGKLPGLDKKVRVAFDWTLDLLFRKDVCAVHDLPPRPGITGNTSEPQKSKTRFQIDQGNLASSIDTIAPSPRSH